MVVYGTSLCQLAKWLLSISSLAATVAAKEAVATTEVKAVAIVVVAAVTVAIGTAIMAAITRTVKQQ